MLSRAGIVYSALATLALAYSSLAHAQVEEPYPAPVQPTAADHSQAPAPLGSDNPPPKSSPVGTDLSTLDTSGGFCSDATSPAGIKHFAKWAAPFGGRNLPGSTITISISMAGNPCLTLPVFLNVPNNQAIQLNVTPHADKDGNEDQKCTTTETVAQLPEQDFGAIIEKFLAGALAAHGLIETPKQAEQLSISLPPLSNEKATISVSCMASGDAPVVPKKTITITYQNMPPVSASAGAIVSLLGNKTYGVVTSETSVTSGTVSSQFAIGITSSSRIQLVPVAFLNAYLLGNRNAHIDLQTGLGINPNGSKTRVEYFVGPAIAWHGVYLSPGLHIAQAEYLARGYAVGQLVSSQSFNVPAPYHTTLRFGISLTYSPKVSSSSSPSNSNSSSK